MSDAKTLFGWTLTQHPRKVTMRCLWIEEGLRGAGLLGTHNGMGVRSRDYSGLCADEVVLRGRNKNLDHDLVTRYFDTEAETITYFDRVNMALSHVRSEMLARRAAETVPATTTHTTTTPARGMLEAATDRYVASIRRLLRNSRLGEDQP